MLGMAVATMVPSIAAMKEASMIEAMTKGRAAGVTVLTMECLSGCYSHSQRVRNPTFVDVSNHVLGNLDHRWIRVRHGNSMTDHAQGRDVIARVTDVHYIAHINAVLQRDGAHRAGLAHPFASESYNLGARQEGGSRLRHLEPGMRARHELGRLLQCQEPLRTDYRSVERLEGARLEFHPQQLGMRYGPRS